VGCALLGWLYLFFAISATLGREDPGRIRGFQFGAVRLAALGVIAVASLAGLQAIDSYRSFVNSLFMVDPRVWLIGVAAITGPGILAGCWLLFERLVDS